MLLLLMVVGLHFSSVNALFATANWQLHSFNVRITCWDNFCCCCFCIHEEKKNNNKFWKYMRRHCNNAHPRLMIASTFNHFYVTTVLWRVNRQPDTHPSIWRFCCLICCYYYIFSFSVCCSSNSILKLLYINFYFVYKFSFSSGAPPLQ